MTKELTLPQAAKKLSISRWTLWKYVKDGKLKASRTPGGHFRINSMDLEVFMRRKDASIGQKTSQKRILIVDDDSSILQFLTALISSEGYEIDLAGDGFEAGIKIATFSPDVVILDLVMPSMDGFEVCRMIKNDPSTEHIKVLALTGFEKEDTQDEIMKAGADAFMTKPVAIDIFRYYVKSLLEETGK